MTVGQRKGLGLPGGGPKRFVVDVDRIGGTVVVGAEADLLCDTVAVGGVTWVDRAVDGDVLVQCSAHGDPVPATITVTDDGIAVAWHTSQRRVAPGQSVVVYDASDTYVLGGGHAT